MILRETYYNLLDNFKEKSAFFWVMIYPSLLCLLFVISLTGDMGSGEINHIPVAVSEDNSLAFVYRTIPVLDVVTEDNYKEALMDEEITAYIDENHDVTVKTEGYDQSIVKLVTDQVVQSIPLGEDAVNIKRNVFVEYDYQVSDYMHLAFYSIIGMTACFGYFAGLQISHNNQPLISEIGRRKSTSPMKKSTALTGGFIAALIINVISFIILFFMMMIVYKLDIFHDLPGTFIISFVGSIFGTALGMFIGALKGNMNVKIFLGVIISITLSMFAGMMDREIYFLVQDNIPWFHEWNPVSIVTQNLLRVNMFGSYETFIPGIIHLLILTAVFLLIAYALLRRKSYDSF